MYACCICADMKQVLLVDQEGLETGSKCSFTKHCDGLRVVLFRPYLKSGFLKCSFLNVDLQPLLLEQQNQNNIPEEQRCCGRRGVRLAQIQR